MVTPLRTLLPLRRWASPTHCHSSISPRPSFTTADPEGVPGPADVVDCEFRPWTVHLSGRRLPSRLSSHPLSLRPLVWAPGFGGPGIFSTGSGTGREVAASAGVLQLLRAPAGPAPCCRGFKAECAPGGVLRGRRPSREGAPPETHPRSRFAS